MTTTNYEVRSADEPDLRCPLNSCVELTFNDVTWDGCEWVCNECGAPMTVLKNGEEV